MITNPVLILHTQNGEPARRAVAAHHPDLAVHFCDSYEALAERIAESGAEIVYSVRFAGTPGFPREALVESDTVRWVSVGGSGTDHLRPWNPDQVTVTNAAGVAADMMAEYVLGVMLAFTLDLKGFAKAKAEEEWVAGRVAPIMGRTVLILGLGRTGQAVAARCKAMGMNVVGVRARPVETPNVDAVHGMDALPRLWERADFVVVCVPLLAGTRGLVNRAALAAMKEQAVLIDVSRGGVVEEEALIEALTSGGIAGAGLDVFATEPLPPGHRLWRLENVILTPHCSSVFEGWELKSVEMFAENLTRYRRGEALVNVVDPIRGY